MHLLKWHPLTNNDECSYDVFTNKINDIIINVFRYKDESF